MKKIISIIGAVLISGLCMAAVPSVSVGDLKCEMRLNPLGIDERTPGLSWKIRSGERNVVQTGFDILVASSREKLDAGEGDLWTGTGIECGESIYVPYAGNELESRTECHWKVRVHTNKGSSEWSEPALWTMGLLSETEWKCRWLGLERSFPGDTLAGCTRLAARYFRHEFGLKDKEVAKATMYICGLGLYEAYINGGRIGDQVLAPTLTDYDREAKYNTFDVTETLRTSDNAIGIVLGNGRFFSQRQQMRSGWLRNYGFPVFLMRLEIEYADGEVQAVHSNNAYEWKATADGPIRANNEYDGEEYDARMEMAGWAEPGFDDSGWLQADYANAPCYRVRAQMNDNIRIMEELKPVSISEPQPGVYILDMGQNMVGWLQMRVSGKSGDRVKLRFAEVTKDDGTLYMDNIREAKVTDLYTLKGGGTEVWEPSFTYHGFRYVEITGWPGVPTIDDFTGKVIYDEMATTGSFETSIDIVNRIYRNGYWGIRGNYRSMPTDCPQRNERLGWLGDRATGSHGESFIFDNNNLYAKWLNDINQSQLPDGSIGDVAPNYFSRIYTDNMTWPGTYLIVADMLYRQFGNKRPIEKHYSSMKLWFDYMADKYLEDYIMPRDRYGDWCMPPESPELIHSKDPVRITEPAVIGTTYFYYYCGLMEKFAALLGKDWDVEKYSALAAKVKESFNGKYLDTAKGCYSNNTITANILPLRFGMVPAEYEQNVFDNIVDITLGRYDGHISTGLVGGQWIMRILTDYGRPDIALKFATNTTYPSWGYMAENGATTIWELWNGNTADPAMNSHNHVMLLGDLNIWFYENLAGIRNAEGSHGFGRIEMKPLVIGGLDYVKGSYDSSHGLIASSWNNSGKEFTWDITVPCNTEATVYIPAADADRIKEGKKKIAENGDIKFEGMKDGYAVCRIGSGDYSFSVKK